VAVQRLDLLLEVHLFLLKLLRQPPHFFFTALTRKRVRKQDRHQVQAGHHGIRPVHLLGQCAKPQYAEYMAFGHEREVERRFCPILPQSL
jgi:hypothetical protein